MDNEKELRNILLNKIMSYKNIINKINKYMSRHNNIAYSRTQIENGFIYLYILDEEIKIKVEPNRSLLKVIEIV